MSDAWTLAVDFGTTSTVTAMGDGAGSSEILEVDGNRKMPSMVVVDNDNTVVVGIAAAGLARSMPQRTIRTPKNRLGDAVPVVVGGTPFQPVAFVTSVLQHVLADATRFQGSPPSRSRLTYPATWNRPKRARLLEAAVKAGYPEPELIAEPIAAALTYADFKTLGIGDHVAVYDLGGGTFDTVVLLRTEGGFSVVGRPLGDPQLGGELFDEILMNYVGEQIDQALWDELLVSDDTDWMRAAARLRAECKRAKEALSSHPVAEVSVGLPGGVVDVQITRDEFNSLIEPFVQESIDLLDQCMKDANMSGETIAAIYVTGGASRMPIVEQRVKMAYPDTIVSRRGDPKVAVALGALLAVPGSLDKALQQTPDRTTLEEEPEPQTNVRAEQPPPPPPTPTAPVVDIPVAPPTVANPTVANPTVSEPDPPALAQAPPAAVPPPVIQPPVVQPPTQQPQAQQPPPQQIVHQEAAAFAAPQTRAPQPAQPSAVLVDPIGAPESQNDSISPKIVVASAVAILAIVGAIAAVLALTNDSGSSSDGGSSTTSSTTSTTIAEEENNTEESTSTQGSANVSQALVTGSLLSLEDLGFGWRERGVVDTVNNNLCGLTSPVEPSLDDAVTFLSTDRSQQLTSKVQFFRTADEASAEVGFSSSFSRECSEPSVDFNTTSELTGDVVPLVVRDTENVFRIEIPDFIQSDAQIAYEFTTPDNRNLDPHVLSVDVQYERAVGTVVLFTPGAPNESHIEFMNQMIEQTSEKLREVQQ